MNFKKWVKSIQTAGYNGARTVDINFVLRKCNVLNLIMCTYVFVFYFHFFKVSICLFNRICYFSRWVFNWAHWSVGNITFIFAIIAIFFAMEYPAVDMPSEVTYVLITYVVLHVVVHTALTIQRFYYERMTMGTPNKGELVSF